jgi:hypothetical protein
VDVMLSLRGLVAHDDGSEKTELAVLFLRERGGGAGKSLDETLWASKSSRLSIDTV